MKSLDSDSRLLLVGAGKMGEALLRGWLKNGLDLKKISVLEPDPSEWLISLIKDGLMVNEKPARRPNICVIAVKPQKVTEVLSSKNFDYDKNTFFISIVAGIKLKKLEDLFKEDIAISRVMPNTPAMINKGVSCYISNSRVTEVQTRKLENLFSVVGTTIKLDDEENMNAVTAISGSGPAYVFYLIEALAFAAVELGLDEKLAYQLSVLIVSGSGKLAEVSDLKAEKLRQNVTSPNGTTAAALEVLADSKGGLVPLIKEAAFAACQRSKALGHMEE